MSGRLVLLRHGQTYGNVEKRLDTRPPGADLTPKGREQARGFARAAARPGLLGHSIAIRARQTAGVIGATLGLTTVEFADLHEVQVGELENRNDDEAIKEFEGIYQGWHRGRLRVEMPGGESGEQVLDRFLPVVQQLRVQYLDDPNFVGDVVVVSHGAAIRLAGAVLGGVDGEFALEHHLANTESVVLAPGAGGEWNCLQWGAAGPPLAPQPRTQPAAEATQVPDPMG